VGFRRGVGTHSPTMSQGAKSRWWRAVSQRVPRDAYRRIAKIDVLGAYSASREKRCRVDRSDRSLVNLMALEMPWDRPRRFERGAFCNLAGQAEAQQRKSALYESAW
jgi:hypothetical protein